MADGPSPDPRPARRLLRVVVADDDPAVRQLCEALLGARGVEVRTAADGVEALAMCRALRPDVLVVDLHMPRLNGFGVVHAVRVDPQLHALPVVAMTTLPLDLVSPHERALGIAILDKEECLSSLPLQLIEALSSSR